MSSVNNKTTITWDMAEEAIKKKTMKLPNVERALKLSQIIPWSPQEEKLFAVTVFLSTLILCVIPTILGFLYVDNASFHLVIGCVCGGITALVLLSSISSIVNNFKHRKEIEDIKAKIQNDKSSEHRPYLAGLLAKDWALEKKQTEDQIQEYKKQQSELDKKFKNSINQGQTRAVEISKMIKA